MAQREPPLAHALPRERGSREVRYVHLLSALRPSQVAEERSEEPTRASQPTGDLADEDRVATLESELADLRARVAELEDKIAKLLE